MHFNKLSYSRDLNYIALQALKMHTPTSSEIIPTLALLFGSFEFEAKCTGSTWVPPALCHLLPYLFILHLEQRR